MFAMSIRVFRINRFFGIAFALRARPVAITSGTYTTGKGAGVVALGRVLHYFVGFFALAFT